MAKTYEQGIIDTCIVYDEINEHNAKAAEILRDIYWAYGAQHFGPDIEKRVEQWGKDDQARSKDSE